MLMSIPLEEWPTMGVLRIPEKPVADDATPRGR